MRVLLFVLGLLLFAELASANCFPQVNFTLEEGFGGGISQHDFNAVIGKLYKHYAPVVAKRGGTLVMHPLWSDGTLNAYADRSDGNWNITLFGGLARFSQMNKLGFMMVACHELGHHLGGAPVYTGDDWAAVEGEADYFSSRCMREMGYSTADIKIGSMALGKSLAAMGGEKMPAPSTPDRSVVDMTFEAHPAAQCRLDTYLNSAACQKRGDFSPTDPKVNSCYQYSRASYGIGSRPRCWFAP